jgi:hypothetical protein
MLGNMLKRLEGHDDISIMCRYEIAVSGRAKDHSKVLVMPEAPGSYPGMLFIKFDAHILKGQALMK